MEKDIKLQKHTISYGKLQCVKKITIFIKQEYFLNPK